MMNKLMETYVDNMIADFEIEVDPPVNLNKVFKRLRKHDPKLDHSKLVLFITLGKLLGLIVSQQGIQIDSTKYKIYHRLSNSTERKKSKGPN